MGGFVGVLVGLPLAVFGFIVMRNPMRLAFLSPLSPGVEGYYQRMVLDTSMRNQLRVLGVLVCLFGSSILTASLGAMLKARFLAAISEELWVLMGLIFCVAWCSGLVIFIWQLFKRQVPNWFAMWRAGVELGPIEMIPSVTPKMQREALFFTVSLLTLAAFAALAAVLHS
ncbi:MAG TPA: hypothetical protein VKD23_08220 [Terriglobales bacterium]|nr:hypothetical protein [Terriglobales bacterium]